MISFLRYRVLCGAVSILFILAGVVAYFQNDGFRYSVDFTGGTQVRLKTNNPYGSEVVKNALAKAGFSNAVIREFGPQELAVRVQEFSNDARGLSQKIKDSFEQNIEGAQVEITEINAIGAGVGDMLRWNSLLGLILCFLLMMGYIAFRFWSISFGVGAVVALMHDVLAILAFFAITQREISPNVVSAILATLGYSINDTIVIFSRIRENFAKLRGQSEDHIVDVSINQTLRRTLLTSLSTALVVVSLVVFGGESLRNLSVTLLFGIIVGTYSSIYMASPVMLLLRR